MSFTDTVQVGNTRVLKLSGTDQQGILILDSLVRLLFELNGHKLWFTVFFVKVGKPLEFMRGWSYNKILLISE